LQIFLEKIIFYIILYFSNINYKNNTVFVIFAKAVYNIIYKREERENPS